MLEGRLRTEGYARSILSDLGERDEAWLDVDPRPPYEGTVIALLTPNQDVDAIIGAVESLELAPDMEVQAQRVETQLESLLVSDEADLLIDLVAEERRIAEAAADRVIADLGRQPALVNVRRADAAFVSAYVIEFRRDEMNRYGVSPALLRPIWRPEPGDAGPVSSGPSTRRCPSCCGPGTWTRWSAFCRAHPYGQRPYASRLVRQRDERQPACGADQNGPGFRGAADVGCGSGLGLGCPPGALSSPSLRPPCLQACGAAWAARPMPFAPASRP